ncbi:MAG: hypothetical protein BGO55_13600 [Sphingobacteriales bacterium 50-39]|nr:DUF4091 domain-containing protein [Sphingobacteriales bacterium]OJW57331.1 MAG: hypothetical protein BGO55_13600 [Sphingobacteriales bacterium 50-39]
MNRRSVIKKGLAAGTLSILGTPGFSAGREPNQLKEQPGYYIEKGQLQFWLETSMRRVYPNTLPGGKEQLTLIAARNEQVSFQACFRNLSTDSAEVKCELTDSTGFTTRIRRVGFVPMRQLNTYTPKNEMEGIGSIPGLCPDPLFDENSVHIGPESNGVFWITVSIPSDMSPGVHTLQVSMTLLNRYGYVGLTNPEQVSVALPVKIDVRRLVVAPRKNFPVTNWVSADSIWEYYKIEPCSERFWELADKFIFNLVAHHNDVLYTPIFNTRHELLKRPAQLLKVKKLGEDRYEFDFSDVGKWVHLALKHGARYIEWSHFFTPAPTSGKYPQRIYERTGAAVGPMLWPPEISATSDTYKNFLKQFIPAFKTFLEQEKILDRSFFHCADEPDGPEQVADYKNARALLMEIAPWMRVMDALSDTRYAKEKITDMPIPSITSALEFKAAGVQSWVYFCCGPRDSYMQRLFDTPLAKIRMAGSVFYRLEAHGFLHWGYNYWYKFVTSEITDPFNHGDVMAWPGLPYGDPFVVYPGPDGPLDSIRWEVFAEGLQDYALLQSAGIKSTDPLLADIKSYADFPKKEEWHANLRRMILERY